jgi:cytidylate kinase
VIAIDGPSASGKGTVASRVAEALGFHYLESGALYRLVALQSARDGIGENEEDALAAIATQLDVAFFADQVLLAGEDVAEALRSELIGTLASSIARLPAVRQALLARQRAFRQPPGLVADGRDMGTVVFPDALLKVFLTASVEVRAERRYKQLNDKGIRANLASLSRDLAERDERDANRAVAPLIPAPGAFKLDSSDLPVKEVVELVVERAREKLESIEDR